MKETERVKGQGGPGHGGPFGGGMVGQKPLAFGPSIKRLGKRLRPERAKVIAVIVAAIVSVALTSLGPRILGRATDIIFSGVVGGFLPEGMTKEQAIDSVRAQGQDQLADMLSGVDLIPGVGIDFTALRNTLILALIIYGFSAVLGFLQAYFLNDVVQHTVLRMR